jgi:hypothetical protein
MENSRRCGEPVHRQIKIGVVYFVDLESLFSKLYTPLYLAVLNGLSIFFIIAVSLFNQYTDIH